jgi:hypothetical protein
MSSINELPTQYIKTSDGHIGVIMGETKTQIIANMPWNARTHHTTRFMKGSHRQVGSPSRSFDYVASLSEV